MTDLKQIIEEAFKAGFEANEIISSDLELTKKFGPQFTGRSYSYYLDRTLDVVEDLPPILTKDILKEIFHSGSFCELREECEKDFKEEEIRMKELLKKYNLGEKDE